MAPLHRVSIVKGSFGLLMLLALSACGGGGNGVGTPGSTGDTGVVISATIVPTYNGKDTYSVDAYQQICTAGPPVVYEYFADHGATVTITTSLIDPLTTSPGILYVEKYTVAFVRSTDSIGAPPILSDTRFDVISIVPSGTTTASVILVDLIRKNKYRTDIDSGLYTSNILNNYTAIYTFEGHNQYGTAFSFQVQTPFQIGSFNYCA